MPTLTATLRARHALICIVGAGLIALGSVMLDARASIADSGHRGFSWHRARTARTTYLSETSNLHLVAHQGTQILHEEGQVTGTLRGQLTVVIDIGYTEASVSFTARSSAGTLTGRGVESYYVSGKTAHFNGRMTVTGGTGDYARASASDLHTTGLIKRAHYEVLMTVDGAFKQ